MHVLVTRPVQDAEPLLAALRARGIEATAEPLLDIEFKRGADLELDDVQAILATSANGVRAFAAAETRRDLPLYAVGDASAQAAREAGFDRVESASGDVLALAGLVAARLDPEAGALLHVAGTQLAGDLGGALKAKGFVYRRAVLYEANPATKLSPEALRAFRKETLDGVLFFSPRTAEIFVTLARKARLVRFCGNMTAFCLSPAVAEQARQIAWREIAVANAPEQDSLLALIGLPSLGPWSNMTQTSDSKPEPGKTPETETPEKDTEETASDSAEAPAESGADFPSSKTHEAAAGAEEAPGEDKTPESPAASEPAQNEPAPTQPAPNQPAGRRRSAIPAAILTTLLILAILGGAVYAARPFWTPYLEAYLQTLEEGPRMASLSERLAALEDQAKAGQKSSDALAEMEQRRAELGERVGTLVSRVAELEESMESVRKMIDATSLPGEAEDARKSIEELSQRLAQLEDSGEMTNLKADLQSLNAESARISSSVSEMSHRIDELEESEATALKVGGEVRESLLAAGRLREALHSAAPFSAELQALRAAAPEDPGLAEVTGQLAPRADSGIPTLATLRERFDAVARDVAATELRMEGDGWVSGMVNRLSSLVSVRRTDFPEDDQSVDAILSRAEDALNTGDLMAAVQQMEALQGDAATAAARWLDDARARVTAERAMAMLHVYAVSLMSPSAK